MAGHDRSRRHIEFRDVLPGRHLVHAQAVAGVGESSVVASVVASGQAGDAQVQLRR